MKTEMNVNAHEEDIGAEVVDFMREQARAQRGGNRAAPSAGGYYASGGHGQGQGRGRQEEKKQSWWQRMFSPNEREPEGPPRAPSKAAIFVPETRGVDSAWSLVSNTGLTVIHLALWGVAANFTVQGLAAWLRIDLTRADIWPGMALWLVPILISAIERDHLSSFTVKNLIWRAKHDMRSLGWFALVAFVDIFTTRQGVELWLRQQNFTSIGGPNMQTMPVGWLGFFVIVLSIFMALEPEPGIAIFGTKMFKTFSKF